MYLPKKSGSFAASKAVLCTSKLKKVSYFIAQTREHLRM